jgi:Mrp family chromosome partitioning ATPase
MKQMKKHERTVTANDLLVVAHAAYRVGVLDALLRSAETAHPDVREKLEGERRRRLEELRYVGISEVAFEDTPSIVRAEVVG